jgi:hypothetical protein
MIVYPLFPKTGRGTHSNCWVLIAIAVALLLAAFDVLWNVLVN